MVRKWFIMLWILNTHKLLLVCFVGTDINFIYYKKLSVSQHLLSNEFSKFAGFNSAMAGKSESQCTLLMMFIKYTGVTVPPLDGSWWYRYQNTFSTTQAGFLALKVLLYQDLGFTFFICRLRFSFHCFRYKSLMHDLTFSKIIFKLLNPALQIIQMLSLFFVKFCHFYVDLWWFLY